MSCERRPGPTRSSSWPWPSRPFPTPYSSGDLRSRWPSNLLSPNLTAMTCSSRTRWLRGQPRHRFLGVALAAATRTRNHLGVGPGATSAPSPHTPPDTMPADKAAHPPTMATPTRDYHELSAPWPYAPYPLTRSTVSHSTWGSTGQSFSSHCATRAMVPAVTHVRRRDNLCGTPSQSMIGAKPQEVRSA